MMEAYTKAFKEIRNLQSVADTVSVVLKSIVSNVLRGIFELSIPGLRVHKQFACMLAMKFSNFDFYDFDSYPKWFNEDSVMQLFSTGSYYGTDGIREYASFFTSQTQDFEVYEDFGDMVLFYDQITSNSDTCKLSFAVERKLEFTEELFNAKTCWTLTGAATTYFDIDTDDSFVTIHRINIWAPPNFNQVAEAKPEAFPPRICGIMQEHCPSVWEENAYTDLNDCEQKLDELNTADGVSFDGNTLACRWLHSAFIEGGNTFHCPHISQVAIPDDNGNIKCQESSNITNADLFSSEELGFFEDAAMNTFGYDESMYEQC